MRPGVTSTHDSCDVCAWCVDQAVTALRHSTADTVTTFAGEGDCCAAAFRVSAESYAALWAKIDN